MVQDPSDKAALKALSKPDDQKLFEKARTTIKTVDLAKAFFALHSFYAAKRTDAPPIDYLETLVKYRMTGAAEFVFLKHVLELRSLSVDELLRVAASAKCISAWIGKGEDSAAKEEALFARFKELPSKAALSALAIWFFECASPNQLVGGLDIFLLEADARPFSSKDTLLLVALTRDSNGHFLGALVSACARNPDARDRVTTEIKYKDELIELFIAGVPKIIQTVDSDSIAFFIQAVFAELLTAKVPARKRWWSAKLLSLAAGVVSHPPCEVSIAILKELDRLGISAEEQLLSGEVDFDRCVIRYHGTPRVSVQPALSHKAADRIALTLAKIDNGDDPRLSLEATALNLGMKHIAAPETIVEYNPEFHEDVAGGLPPGARVIVLSGGWQYGQQTIERAKVKPI